VLITDCTREAPAGPGGSFGITGTPEDITATAGRRPGASLPRMPHKRAPPRPDGVIEYLTMDRIPEGEQIMAEASALHPAPPPATVADVMHPPVTTVEQNDHVAGAAYLMKRAGATALVVTQAQTLKPVGIITEADISHLVADGKNPNDVRIYQLMTARPTVVSTTTSIRDAARVMTSGRFRHLPVMGGPGLVGIVDITDICRALLDISEAAEEPLPDP
jgi:CBS domain-containing protein